MSKLAVFVSAIALLLGILSIYIAQHYTARPLTVSQIEGVRANNFNSAGSEPSIGLGGAGISAPLRVSPSGPTVTCPTGPGMVCIPSDTQPATSHHTLEWCDGWQTGWQEAAAKVWYYRNALRALYGQPPETQSETRARILKSVAEPPLPPGQNMQSNNRVQQAINTTLDSVDIYVTLHFDSQEPKPKAEGCR